MVTRLLQACGLFLGREDELGFDSNDGEPHFENVRFVALNDEILSRLGGSWNNPPELSAGWERMPAVEALTGQAKKLIKRISSQHPWGWKDPRNSLTLAFWRRLIPDLKLVICLRNPVEVAHSLRKRGDLIGITAVQLWLTYYRELVSATLIEQRVITHYNSYFQDPTTELQRVANMIGMDVPDGVISRACAHISSNLRHHHIESPINVPQEVLDMYLKLCREAGPVYQSEYDAAIMSSLRRECAT